MSAHKPAITIQLFSFSPTCLGPLIQTFKNVLPPPGPPPPPHGAPPLPRRAHLPPHLPFLSLRPLALLTASPHKPLLASLVLRKTCLNKYRMENQSAQQVCHDKCTEGN